jgi:hypothetical protein
MRRLTRSTIDVGTNLSASWWFFQSPAFDVIVELALAGSPTLEDNAGTGT